MYNRYMYNNRYMYFYFVGFIIFFYYLYNKFFTIKEGIIFTKPYFLDKYKRDHITIDSKNYLLEKNGNIINYKNINEYKLLNHKTLKNKSLVKKILEKNNIPVCNAYTWNKDISDKENLNNMNTLNLPLVVKPVSGEKGYGVKTDIMTSTELLTYVNQLLTQQKNVLIEEQAKGKEYRIMVLNDTIIGITMKSPPSVKGDGENTLQQLIDHYNSKKTNEFKIHTIDDEYIKFQGYNTNTILPLDKKVIITNVANMSNGSLVEYVDINNVHPDNITLFKKINNILGLNLSGIDYICEDLSIPYYLDGYVIEVNNAPGIDIHYDVTPENKKDDLLDRILKNIF